MEAAQAIRPQADCVSLGSSTRSCPLTLHLCRDQQPCRDLVVNRPAAAKPEPESPGVQSSPEICVHSSFLAFRAGKSSRIPAPSLSPHRQRGVEASQFLQCSGQALTHPHSSTGTWERFVLALALLSPSRTRQWEGWLELTEAGPGHPSTCV